MATINDSVYVVPSENMIHVNDTPLNFSLNNPDAIKNIPINLVLQIYWKWGGENKIAYYEDKLYGEKYREMLLTDADWQEVVKPYADQWQAEKDRIEQEQQAAAEEYAKFSSRQIRAYTLINDNYKSALENAGVATSLGYDADISADSSATLLATKMNLDNGVYDTVNFVDYHDLNREIDGAKCETLISEINQTQNHLRDQKQDFMAQVKNCSSNEQLDALLPTLKFTTLDFTQDTATASEETMPKQYKEVEITYKQLDMLTMIDKI